MAIWISLEAQWLQGWNVAGRYQPTVCNSVLCECLTPMKPQTASEQAEARLSSLSLTAATRASTPINKQALSRPLLCSTVLAPALCQSNALLLQTLRGSCWAPQQPPPTLQGAAEPLCAQLRVPTQCGYSSLPARVNEREPRPSIKPFSAVFLKEPCRKRRYPAPYFIQKEAGG